MTRTTANAGEMVDVFANPDPNYHLKSLAYRTASGETVSIDNNRFVMPNEDVTIVAEFERLPRLLIAGYGPGVDLVVTSDTEPLVDADGIYATHILAGDPITFAFTPLGEDRSFLEARVNGETVDFTPNRVTYPYICLLYTSPSPRDRG